MIAFSTDTIVVCIRTKRDFYSIKDICYSDHVISLRAPSLLPQLKARGAEAG